MEHGSLRSLNLDFLKLIIYLLIVELNFKHYKEADFYLYSNISDQNINILLLQVDFYNIKMLFVQ